MQSTPLFKNTTIPGSVASSKVPVKFQRFHPDVKLPQTWSEHAIGMDLHAHLLTPDGRPNTAIIPPRSTRMIGCGFAAEPQEGYYLTIHSRSGIAKKNSVFVPNGPGIIDPDYRGEIGALLYNGGYESYYVKHGERIAQLVLNHVIEMQVVESALLSSSSRAGSGFGSTGT